MITTDKSYFIRRAAEARHLSLEAINPAVRAIHHDLMVRYQQLAVLSDQTANSCAALPELSGREALPTEVDRWQECRTAQEATRSVPEWENEGGALLGTAIEQMR